MEQVRCCQVPAVAVVCHMWPVGVTEGAPVSPCSIPMGGAYLWLVPAGGKVMHPHPIPGDSAGALGGFYWCGHNTICKYFQRAQAFVNLVPKGQLSTPKTHTTAAETVCKCKNFTQEQGLKLFSFWVSAV